MKRAITLTILSISLFTAFFASAQKTVNQPGFGATNAPKLNTPAKNSLLPRAMHAAWFKTNGSKDWVLDINNRKIIYDSRAWDYKVVTATQGTYKISLKNGKTVKYIYLKNVNNQLTAWEDGKPKQLLTDKPGDQKFAIANDSPFTSPLFKNDSATLTGFINGYSPKLGFKTGLIYVNDIISGRQNSYPLNIAGDGSFKAKLPMAYPEGVLLDIGNTVEIVFMAPDKKLFVYIDLLGGDQKYKFMGDYATLSRELKETSSMMDFDANNLTAKAAELTLMQYQNYIIDLQNKCLEKIDNHRAEHGLSLKAYQVVTNNIKYQAARFLLEYNEFREKGQYEANKGKDKQDIIAYKPVKLDETYLSVLANYPLNDELSVLCESYDTFINQLKFIDGVIGYLNRKQMKYLIEAFNAVPPVDEGEKKLQAAMIEVLKSGEGSLNDIRKSNPKPFETDNPQRSVYFKAHPLQVSSAEAVNSLIKSDISFTRDVIEAQDHAGIIGAQLKPKNITELAEIKTRINNPDVYNALARYNQSIADKIAANSKIKTGFVFNKMPKTTADSVFNAILSKYKGKAVYIDFWATWCLPCRAGIEEIAPLKEELKKENVAFIYITDPSSPEDIYKKLVPGIPGEHYKLNKDEWNYIAGKFSITGIPRYMLVNKSGMIVNDRYSGAGNADLKRELLKIAAE